MASGPRSYLFIGLLAVILTLPGLWLGWQTDDHFHRAALTDEFARLATARRSFPEMFAFIKDGLVAEGGVIDRGELPWWSAPDLRLAFYRPVTGLTHWIDYQLWPETPWLMHAHSIAWYVATVMLAALLFRRFSAAPVVAGLSAVIYAVSDNHGLPAVWLANRNAVLAAFFGIFALLFYDRWRRDGSIVSAWLAPVALAAAILSNEGAVAVGGYLFAYALFVDPDRTWRRFAALIPYIGAGICWWYFYKVGGYGAVSSGVYIDPAADPIKFITAVVERAPILFYGLFSVPFSDVHILLSQPAFRLFWCVGIAVMALIIVYAAPFVRADRNLRFAAVGMLLSILPACTTFASDRLLMFAGLGATMIIARLISAAWRPVASPQRLRGVSVIGGALVIIHLVLSPIGLVTASKNVRDFGVQFERAAMSMPDDEAIKSQRMVIVSTPSAFLSSFAGIYAATQHRPVPQKTLVMGSGVYEVTVTRTDDRTLLVSQAGGWLLSPGHWPRNKPDQFKWFGDQYLLQTFDKLFRDDQPFEPNHRIELSDGVIEIVDVTADGRPATVRFRFNKPLEDDGFRWVCWEDDKYARFDLPAVGGTVVLRSLKSAVVDDQDSSNGETERMD